MKRTFREYVTSRKTENMVQEIKAYVHNRFMEMLRPLDL